MFPHRLDRPKCNYVSWFERKCLFPNAFEMKIKIRSAEKVLKFLILLLQQR